MKCKYCNCINDNDAIFCKQCGNSLSYDSINNKKNRNMKKTKPKIKTKTKIKKKTKVKKEKSRNNNTNRKNNNTTIKSGSPFKSFIIFILILMILSLCGVIFYFYYQKQNIKIPNLIGLSYDEAHIKLAESNLKIDKIEREVDDISDVDVVISQSKKPYSKTKENSTVKVVIGVMKKYRVDNFVNMNIETAKSKLNSKNIKYEIKIKEVKVGKDNIVLSQNPTPGSVITVDKIVYLTVSNKIKDNKEYDEDETVEEDEKSN